MKPVTSPELTRRAEATDRAFAAVVAGPGRRLRRLLAELARTNDGFSPNTLQGKCGSHVHELLTELAADGRVETDLAGRIRLTAYGRAMARRASGRGE